MKSCSHLLWKCHLEKQNLEKQNHFLHFSFCHVLLPHSVRARVTIACCVCPPGDTTWSLKSDTGFTLAPVPRELLTEKSLPNGSEHLRHRWALQLQLAVVFVYLLYKSVHHLDVVSCEASVVEAHRIPRSPQKSPTPFWIDPATWGGPREVYIYQVSSSSKRRGKNYEWEHQQSSSVFHPL